MRIVRSEDELETNFLSASREATTAFGNVRDQRTWPIKLYKFISPK